MMLRPWHWILIALLALGLWQTRLTPVSPPLDTPSVAIHASRSAPAQRMLSPAPVVQQGDYELRLLAEFAINARVLGRENYRLGRESDLSPWDFALGWGAMADPSISSQFSIRQSGRWYYWRTDQMPIPRQQVITSSANMHLIPASDQVREQLERLDEGDDLNFKGFLVEAQADDGWRWRSSLRRDDTGNGACEVILVTEVL